MKRRRLKLARIRGAENTLEYREKLKLFIKYWQLTASNRKRKEHTHEHTNIPRA